MEKPFQFFYYKPEKPSLKQEVIDGLVSDGDISAEELQIYRKVERAIERRYRKLLHGSGPSAISERMELFSRWRQIREDEIDRLGQDSVVTLFSEEEIEFGLTTHNAMSYWLRDGLGNNLEATVKNLAHVELNFPPAVNRNIRRVIINAQERARRALEMREEL